MKILALDASTTRTGWAIQPAPDEMLQYGAIAAAGDVEKRIGKMRDEVIKLCEKYNPDIIAMEEVRPTGANTHTGKVLNWLQGCIAVAVYEYNKKIQIEFIGASSWRSKIGIQGHAVKREAQKTKDIAYANARWGLQLTEGQDDEADAIGILTSRLMQNKPAAARLSPIGSDESAF